MVSTATAVSVCIGYLINCIAFYVIILETKDNGNLVKSAENSKNPTPTFSDFFKSMKSKVIDLEEEVVKVKSDPKKNSTPKMPSFGFDPAADPVFGLRMINPLLSSQTIQDKMVGKIPVPVNRVKMHLKSANNSDWVVAGILVNKSLPKTSQKGIHHSHLIYLI